MSENAKNHENIETLNESDTVLLNRQGWHLVTLFQTREGGDESEAYHKALNKAVSHDREAGIRCVVKDGVTYYEVWDRW